MSDARDVIRDMARQAHSAFSPPPTKAFRLPDEKKPLIPGLEAAFTPVNRRTKTCGREVELRFGIHEMTMVATYPCESREEEFRNAPGSTLIDGNSRDERKSLP